MENGTFTVEARKPAYAGATYIVNDGWGSPERDTFPITVSVKKPAIAINEWTWEGFGKQGTEAVVALNIDDITTSDQLIASLQNVLPQRIYGSSSGNKQDSNIEGYEFEKYLDKENKSLDYLNIDWSGLADQINLHNIADIISGTASPFTVEAKLIKNNTDYYINDGWGTDEHRQTFPITIQTMSFESHTVQAANPDVTVNLFDYWVKTQNPTEATNGDILDKSDAHYHEEGGEGALSETTTGYSAEKDWNLGINQGHLLLFGDGMIHAGLWNKGAGENCRYSKQYAGMEGIVKNTLPKSGYPEMNLASANIILTGDNSRDYTLIKDYKLTGDHNEKQHTNQYGTPGNAYDSDNIQNLSNTVIRTWGKNIDTDTESLEYLFTQIQSLLTKQVIPMSKGYSNLTMMDITTTICAKILLNSAKMAATILSFMTRQPHSERMVTQALAISFHLIKAVRCSMVLTRRVN